MNTTDVKKMNKTELTKVLNLNFDAVKKSNKSLADRIVYTAKAYKSDDKSVTKKDLLDLVSEAKETLGDSFILEAPAETPKVESQTKKLKAKPSKKNEEKKPEAESEPVEEPEEEKKPAGKKTSSSKKPEKKSAVRSRDFVLAEVFSDTITLDDGSEYQIAHDIKNMDDLMKAYDNGETVVFAMYWTKRHIAQFEYFRNNFETPDGGFPLDLDLASCIYVSEEGVVAYATSLYTEACYMYFPNDFEEIDGIRFSGGVEFQIYRKVEEPEEE